MFRFVNPFRTDNLEFRHEQAIDEAEGKEMLKGMAADCKEKEGASDADVEEMINKKIPTNKPAKCLNACMMDQFGVVSLLVS